MKIGILTSSRADYGIYLPLLEKLKKDNYFSIEVIAFGTHLSKSHGFTLNDIIKDGYPIIHRISSLVSNDDESSIVTSYGLTILKFAEFWTVNKYDAVLCLGDRFEMSAAVQAGIVFGINFGHIHGGENTLGAIDNIYRHQITLAANFHFVSTSVFKEKVSKLIDSDANVYAVGALSLDNINNFKPIPKDKFYERFEIKEENYALVTFHPETVSSENNHKYAKEIYKALSIASKSLLIVITMPNADTLGSIFREEILKLKEALPNRIILVENFGKENYFSAMHYSKLLIGNTSSGIIEAASFGKYVVNVGNRQKGRLQSENIIDSKFNSKDISKAISKGLGMGIYKGKNVYYHQGAVNKIIQLLKESL